MIEQPKLVKVYQYHDEQGKLVYESFRYEPGPGGSKKTFKQGRPGEDGKTIWNMNGVTRVLYRLPDLLKSAAEKKMVIVVEGEKDVDNLVALGFVATTNVGGAGGWEDHLGRWLRGRHVAIIPDNDLPGRRHAAQVAGNLVLWGAASIRVVRLTGLAEHGDVSDWLADSFPSATPEQKRQSLIDLIRAASEWVFKKPA